MIVRGAVERIDFMGSRLTDVSNGKITVGTVTGGFVVIQNVSSNINYEQNGPSTVVLKNAGGLNSAPNKATTGPNATGDVHLENCRVQILINQPINLFARGTNREGSSASIAGGATAWIFGDNVEAHDGKGDPYLTVTGSTLEVLAGALDNLATAGRFNSTTGAAHYDATDSRLSIVVPGVHRGSAVTGHAVSDVVKGARVGNVTSAQMVVDSAVGDFRRVGLPLYVSP